MTDHCLVAGGGVLGLFTALTLRKRGWTVTLLEKQTLGCGASRAAGGILCPLYPWRQSRKTNFLLCKSLRLYQRFFREAAALGEEVAFSSVGMCCFDSGDYLPARMWAKTQRRHQVSWLQQQLRNTFPRFRAGRGFFLPGICQVDPAGLLSSLARLATHYGVSIRENQQANQLLLRKGKVTGLLCGRERISSDAVVICAGAWSKGLIPDAEVLCPVRPVKGQMIEYRVKPGLLPHILLWYGKYLIPRQDGRILVGSTLENAGFDTTTTAVARNNLERFARKVFPVLSACRVSRQWAGLRPALANPLIGSHPDIRGLFINTGHYRNGIALAPASADVIAEACCRG